MQVRVGIVVVSVAALCGCEGLVPAAIDAAQRQSAENERVEKERKRRARERERTRELLRLLATKRKAFEAGVTAVEAAQPADAAAVKALRARWKALRAEALQGIPSDARREVRLSRTDDDLRAFQKEVLVPRHTAYRALRARVQETRQPLERALIRKAIAAKAPLQARTLLFPAYNRDVNTRDDELRGFAQAIATQYDAVLLQRFQTYGAYGQLGASRERAGCVFSRRAWPEGKLGPITARFQTHFRGAGPVFVLGRLPLPAKRYGNRAAGELVIELISQQHGVVDVARRSSLGDPATMGDARYVRAAFELPPPRFDHQRFFYDARVLLVWEDGRGRRRQRVLAQSSFTWQAD